MTAPQHRWFGRLDEWQHAHAPTRGGVAWYWLWRPLCNYTERMYQR